jgi:hypothetical protein
MNVPEPDACARPREGLNVRCVGRLAQLVERFVYTEDVGSSSLSSPTIISKGLVTFYEECGRFGEPEEPHPERPVESYFEQRLKEIASTPGLVRKVPSKRRNVTRERNRHGKMIYYYRPSKGPRIRLPNPHDVGEAEFQRAYEMAVRGEAPVPTQRPRKLPPYLKDFGETGYVYFLRMGRAVKIGFTRDVRKRMSAIQSSCPAPTEVLKVIPGVVNTERYFHEHFAEYRLSGEWFSLEGDLCAFLSVPVS